MTYDFSDLSPEQRNIIASGGWRWSAETPTEPDAAVVDLLLVRKLVEGRHGFVHLADRRDPLVSVQRSLVVPVDVARAWRRYLVRELSIGRPD
jgi:hypothetical protein